MSATNINTTSQKSKDDEDLSHIKQYKCNKIGHFANQYF